MTALLSLSFDNLGEAAELEMGALAADASLGSHPTATEVVPRLLERLDRHGLATTFFVEGLNAELYPDLLREIAARGHEVAYHAWRHEQWGELSAVEQAENLRRGIDAFERIGIELAGLRPPGGQLGPGGVAVLREAGLRHCSPAGSGSGIDDGIALLPFAWRHVDAACVLPPLAAAREQIGGSPAAVEPSDFVAWLEREVGALAGSGGYMAIVLHPFMFGWLGDRNLERLHESLTASAEGDGPSVTRCVDAAERVLTRPEGFAGELVLDPGGWSG
jgi:peptidoglycan/xylan/chitin deacetylase (PgdA/CDA1 family)